MRRIAQACRLVQDPCDQIPVAHREITDETGRVWMVWEVTPGSVPRRRKTPDTQSDRGEQRSVVAAHLSEGWLAFETSREKRRLAPTPEGWVDLADEDLLDLLERAKPVRSTRRLLE